MALDARVVPAVVSPVEFRHPWRSVGLHDRPGPRAAHRVAEQHQVLHLLRLRIGWQVVPDQSVRQGLQLLEIDRLVEFALGRRRFRVESEAERARTVVG
ncbi:hypothetical protein [Rhodopseudomonas faecalis]|uniref:hypothetical protein n=1 Tax=Rhodopseudomonas faecalis TaxID=99655 RepID=UPI001FE0D0AB|nr:hypothetical protein [Rhodopseudomonas faecalis]